MTILVEPKKITFLLSLVVACLTLAHTAGQILIYTLGPQRLLGLGELFDLNGEGARSDLRCSADSTTKRTAA